MKKIIALIMCLSVVLCFAACGKQEDKGPQEIQIDAELVSTTASAEEYSAYKDIFYDGKADNYENKDFSKSGTFAVLYDEFNNTTRYYVWGYDEKTKGDWQWELKLEGDNIPKVGSIVEASGKLEKDSAALDGYWLTDPQITVKEEYKGAECDVNMSVMSPTLARVQMSNLQNHKETNNGKTVSVFAAIATENLLRHPYSEESWQMHYSANGNSPKAGTLVIAYGTFNNGILENASFTEIPSK